MLHDRWVRRAAILVSWCERNWGEYKIPVGSGGGVKSVGVKGRNKYLFRPPWPPPPPPTGILYSSQLDQDGSPSRSTIPRKNRGLWTVYILLFNGTFHVDKIHVWFKIANIAHALLVPVYRQTDFTPKWVVVSRLHDTVAKFRTGVKFSPRCENRGELTPGWLAPA